MGSGSRGSIGDDEADPDFPRRDIEEGHVQSWTTPHGEDAVCKTEERRTAQVWFTKDVAQMEVAEAHLDEPGCEKGGTPTMGR